jgi:hypothetical protein
LQQYFWTLAHWGVLYYHTSRSHDLWGIPEVAQAIKMNDKDGVRNEREQTDDRDHAATVENVE